VIRKPEKRLQHQPEDGSVTLDLYETSPGFFHWEGIHLNQIHVIAAPTW